MNDYTNALRRYAESILNAVAILEALEASGEYDENSFILGDLAEVDRDLYGLIEWIEEGRPEI